MLVKVFMSCCGGDDVLKIVNEAVRLSGTDTKIETASDLIELAKAGIMSTPAIAINNKIVVSGKVPKVQDLVKLLTKAAEKDA